MSNDSFGVMRPTVIHRDGVGVLSLEETPEGVLVLLLEEGENTVVSLEALKKAVSLLGKK